MRKANHGEGNTLPSLSPAAFIETPNLEIDADSHSGEAAAGQFSTWYRADPSFQAEGGLASHYAPAAAPMPLGSGRRRDVRVRPVRLLAITFRRNPEHDGQTDRIRYEGYHICWPNGQPVSVGFQRFCQLGSRLLGLGRRMAGKDRLLVEIGFHEVEGLESPLTRVAKGVRTRRFFLERHGPRGRIFFFNGTPTDMLFDENSDDPRVLSWLGWRTLEDGGRRWFDLSARTIS